MTKVLKCLLTAGALTVSAGAASAVTFNAIDNDTSKNFVWELNCTSGCTLEAFDDTSNSFNDGIAGALGAVGDAFTPVTGQDADPAVNGAGNENTVLSNLAAALGLTAGTYTKVYDGGNDSLPTALANNTLVLWKAGSYAGFAKVTTGGTGFLFDTATGGDSNTSGLSHFSQLTYTIPPVPLPAAGWLLLMGLGGLGIASRRKSKAQTA